MTSTMQSDITPGKRIVFDGRAFNIEGVRHDAPKRLGAGDLKHLAELQSKAETQDGGGGVTVVWSKDRDLWCLIQPISINQSLESMRRQSTVGHEIFARDDDGEFITVFASEGRVAT